MKTLKLGLVIGCLIAAGVSLAAVNGEETWSGVISDSICRMEHLPISEGDPVLPAPECTRVCIRGGSRYVFVSDEKVFDIEDQKRPELDKFAGQPIKLTGVLHGSAISISKIEATAGR